MGIAIVLADCNKVGFGQEVQGFLGGCGNWISKLGKDIVDGVDWGK
jgi:predicted small secreted protein